MNPGRILTPRGHPLRAAQQHLSQHSKSIERLVGQSSAIQRVREMIRRVGASECNVLVVGETGTGKELVARAIHDISDRSHRSFVSLNCAAVPDTLLESELFGYERGAFTGATQSSDGKLRTADGGTIFFDEIGEMSQYAQAKVLRAIEAKEIQRLGGKCSLPVDCRIVAATNQDLEKLVAEGKFRADLYYRLDVTRIELPPLRERKDDLRLLLHYYITELNKRTGIQVEGFRDDVMQLLLQHEWRGNVRELRNLVEAVFVNPIDSWITIEDLPDHFRRRLPVWDGVLLDAERESVLTALRLARGNKSKAAHHLNCSRMTLYRKLAKLGIPP